MKNKFIEVNDLRIVADDGACLLVVPDCSDIQATIRVLNEYLQKAGKFYCGEDGGGYYRAYTFIDLGCLECTLNVGGVDVMTVSQFESRESEITSLMDEHDWLESGGKPYLLVESTEPLISDDEYYQNKAPANAKPYSTDKRVSLKGSLELAEFKMLRRLGWVTVDDYGQCHWLHTIKYWEADEVPTLYHEFREQCIYRKVYFDGEQLLKVAK